MLPRLPLSLRPRKWRFHRRWIVRLLLPLSTAFLCTLVSPVLAKSPAVNPAHPRLSSTLAQSESLVQQGKVLYDEEQFSLAVKVLQQAVSAFAVRGDSLRQATTLSNLSLAYQQLGLWSQATEAITDSLNLLRTGRNIGDLEDHAQVQALALNTQGRLQLAQGQAQLALTTLQQATTAYTKAGDQTGIALSLLNQAQAMQASGFYRRALATLTQVNQTLQKQPDSPLKAAGLHSLGNALRVVGDLEQSRLMLKQSLALAQKLKSPEDIAAALFSLGNTARTQQDTKAALAFYQQAATASTSQIKRIQAQLNQLSLLLETKQWSAAQALLPQIQSQISTFPSSRAAVYAQINFAQSLVKQGSKTALQQASALSANQQKKTAPGRVGKKTAPPYLRTSAQLLASAVKQAKTLGDSRAEAYALGSLGGLYEQTQQWSDAKDLTQQALILSQAINAPDIGYRFSWQLGRLLKAQGDVKGAIAAYTEAVDNLKSLRNDLVAINTDVQFSFREEVEPVYRQLVDLLLQSELGSQPSQQNLVSARAVIESLQLAELDNFFRTACLEAKPVLIDSIIDKQEPTAAVIYPIILADRLEVILKLPQQQNLRHYRTSVPQSQVRTTLEQLRQNLEKPYTAPEGKFLSQQVYDWLIKPAEAELAQSQVKTLVFVLDGALRNIPMAALYDGKQYLVEKYSVALTPGLSLLNPKPLAQVHLKALAAGLTEARLGFSALDSVAHELNQIKTSVPSVLLVNQQFTSTALTEHINSVPFSVVHLATHGQFSSNSEQTFIVAWDKPIKVDELSHLLELRDQNQGKALELLVLSACETAAGDRRAALGLAGVAVRSGARSTVASLWNVNDESGSLLLSHFYQELINTKVTKAEALRRAQLALLKDSTWRHPAYWGAYVLVGNWL